MPQTLMDEVIHTFQAVGSQGRQNSILIRMVAERLRAQGKAVKTGFGVMYTRRWCPTPGRIDLSIVDNGVTVAVEVDHASPRKGSLSKLRASNATFKLVVLTSPRASDAPPQQEEGIDAIVALRQPDYPDAEAPLAAAVPPSEARWPVDSYASLDRRQRLDSKADLRRKGRTPSKEQYVYRVQPEVVAIPPWAYAKRVQEFDATADYVWLKSRQLADRLAKMDREENGHPELMRVQAKRCRACGLLKLNLLAQHRKKLDESAFDGRLLPCGPECITRRRQQKGQI